MQRTGPRSGFVVLLGRPSAGKSSLINAICGQHVSIVSPVPQTTRNVIRAIHSEERGQIVFLDTPGLHQSDRQMNRRLRELALEQITEAEAAIYLIDATRPPGDEERDLAGIIGGLDLPVLVATTKCDLEAADPARCRGFLLEQGISTEPVEIGGLPEELVETRFGVSEVLDRLFALLPEGHAWYPEEYYTDQEPAFRIAEIVREAAIRRARQELPHAMFVEVADLEQRDSSIWARVFILVERESQQGIVVGKGGATITGIRREAESRLAELFPHPVKLSIQVKVRPKWRNDGNLLKRIIT